jgi:hypothetical protein
VPCRTDLAGDALSALPGRRAGRAVWLALFAAAALLRWPWQERQGLWADEIFSLAVATGHSLEHAAAAADPALGDFVEGQGARPARDWASYLAQDDPPATITRVIRATLLSDTSPPFYYVLLDLWTRAAGTTDRAVRLFSVLWALASFPLLWSLARSLGGPRAAASTCLLYGLAPVSVYYSLEGRMYSLLWFLALGQAVLSLRLHERGVRTAALLAWSACAAAGLLTHYFFAFVWVACAVWLAIHPGRARRPALLGGAFVTVLLILPWYLHVPESLGRWRVTAGWLDGRVSPGQALAAPLQLGWSLLSGRGVWGGVKWVDRGSALLFLAIGLAALASGPRPLISPKLQLLWIWLAAACLGPLAFDVWRGTLTSQVPRYALAGLPAAMLLAGIALARLSTGLNLTLLALCAIAWLPGLRPVLLNSTRAWEPYRQVGARLGAWAGQSDLVIVHSIPSGVLGIARYTAPDVALAAWVGQLGKRRVPEDLKALIAGRRRVALVRIHEVGQPAPEEAWLRENARLVGEKVLQGAHVLYFEPADGGTFAASAESTPVRR